MNDRMFDDDDTQTAARLEADAIPETALDRQRRTRAGQAYNAWLNAKYYQGWTAEQWLIHWGLNPADIEPYTPPQERKR